MKTLLKKTTAAVMCLLLALTVPQLASCTKKEPAAALDSTQLSYDYDLKPYVTLGTYMGVEVTAGSVEVTDDDIENEIQYILYTNSGTNQITEGTVASGDIVNIDYTGYDNGTAFEGGTAAGTNLTIGSGSFIPGFEDGLIGAAVGDTVTLDLTFPADYTKADMAGKAVEFKVKINYILELVQPDLTDEFVQNISDCDTVNEFREQVRTSLINQKSDDLHSQKINSVWEKVMENATIIKYPEGPLEYYRLDFISYYTDEANKAGKELEAYMQDKYNITLDEFYDDAKSYAENHVKEDLVFYSIVKEENISISDDEYQSGLQEYYLKYKTQFTSTADLEQQAGQSVIRTALLWDKTQEMLSAAALEIKSSADQ